MKSPGKVSAGHRKKHVDKNGWRSVALRSCYEKVSCAQPTEALGVRSMRYVDVSLQEGALYAAFDGQAGAGSPQARAIAALMRRFDVDRAHSSQERQQRWRSGDAAAFLSPPCVGIPRRA